MKHAEQTIKHRTTCFEYMFRTILGSIIQEKLRWFFINQPNKREFPLYCIHIWVFSNWVIISNIAFFRGVKKLVHVPTISFLLTMLLTSTSPCQAPWAVAITASTSPCRAPGASDIILKPANHSSATSTLSAQSVWLHWVRYIIIIIIIKKDW